MEWKLDKSRYVIPQICEQICAKITGGEFKIGQKLPSVRELAVDTGVNPNTVQRCFEELEQQNVLFSVRGSGWYVSENEESAKQVLNKIIFKKTENYFTEMAALGFNSEAVKNYIKEWNNG